MNLKILKKLTRYFNPHAIKTPSADEVLRNYKHALDRKLMAETADDKEGNDAYNNLFSCTYALIPHVSHSAFRVQVDRLIDNMHGQSADVAISVTRTLAGTFQSQARLLAEKIVARTPDLAALQAYGDACQEKHRGFILEWAEKDPHVLLDFITGRNDEAGDETHGLEKADAILNGDAGLSMTNRDIFEARMLGVDMFMACDKPYFEALMHMDVDRTFGFRPKDTIGAFAMLLVEGPEEYFDEATRIYKDLRNRMGVEKNASAHSFVMFTDFCLARAGRLSGADSSGDPQLPVPKCNQSGGQSGWAFKKT